MEKLSGFGRQSVNFLSLRAELCRQLTLKMVSGKSKGHYCISQEAAISPNLLKFNISAQRKLGSRLNQSRRVSLALGSLTTLRCKWSYFLSSQWLSAGDSQKPIWVENQVNLQWEFQTKVLKFDSKDLYHRFVIEDFGW